MAEVKWIKIVTDIFDNRKIKLIRKMPEGNAIVVTWFQLLCLAGETNDNGLIYITKAIPYTEESLSNAFDTPLPIVRLALETFQGLEMIDIVDSFLCISNWEKYQNVDGLSRIREQTRARVAAHREKQKQLAQCNVTVTLPVTLCNTTEEEKDIDKELDKETKVTRKRFTPPTFEEVEEYCRERGKGVNPQKWYDHYTSNGWKVGKNPMKDWRAAVRTWEEDTRKKPGRFDALLNDTGG